MGSFKDSLGQKQNPLKASANEESEFYDGQVGQVVDVVPGSSKAATLQPTDAQPDSFRRGADFRTMQNMTTNSDANYQKRKTEIFNMEVVGTREAASNASAGDGS